MSKGSKPTQAELLQSVVKLSATGCWSWSGKHTKQGYAVASGWKVARLLWTYTQRLQLQTGTGLYHSCRNVRCVNPAHMRPGTGKGRKQDTRNRKYGDDHYSTTISDADVAEMKRLYADKMNPITQAELGKRFGVSQAQVSRILTGQRRRGTRSAF